MRQTALEEEEFEEEVAFLRGLAKTCLLAFLSPVFRHVHLLLTRFSVLSIDFKGWFVDRTFKDLML